MNKFILGGLTFSYNPEISFPILRPKKTSSVVKTLSSVAYFSWPATIVGEIIPFEWEWMEATQFDSLDALYVADNEIIFDPSGGGGGTTYNVILKELEGVYWLNLDTLEAYRKNISMHLLVLSQN
jgi:hypothetical protein